MEPQSGALQTVILAGGKGTRIRALAGDVPKHLIPFHGTPFAHYQLTWLYHCGVREVLYCIGYQGERIREYVGNGAQWGLQVKYVDEGSQLRGTAGALRLAYDASKLASTFFVLYGDSFLPIDFSALGHSFLAQRRPAMMAVLRNEGRWDSSNVRFGDGVVHLYDKFADPETRRHMAYIDYGVSALSADLIGNYIQAGVVADLALLYTQLSQENRLAGFEVAQRFYEIGSPAGLRDFASWLDSDPLARQLG